MAPPVLFIKRIYAECSGETTKSSQNPLREPAFFKSDGTPINKTRFFDQLESRLKVKSKNVIFLGENHLGGFHLHFLLSAFHFVYQFNSRIVALV